MEPLEPLPKPVLSLCMIVKNERENLPRCLASAKPYVDEMIVVDTGSQDETPEIALQYGAKVEHFDWCDDFAAARNYALSQVSGDWILVLDADEELVVEAENFKEQLAVDTETTAYGMIRIDVNVPNVIGGFHGRLFRNLPHLRYENRFHEQLKYKDTNLAPKYKHLKGAKILHYGNIGDDKILEKTLNRNIPILEKMRQEEGLSLWLLDVLARMYTRVEQIEKAEACYAEAFDRLLPHLMEGKRPEDSFWVPTLIHFFGTQLLEQEDYETVRLMCQRGLEWCPEHPPLNYLSGEVLMAFGFPLGAKAYFENCLQMGQVGSFYQDEPFEVNFMTTYPAYKLGCAYMQMQCLQEALAAFELALSFDANFTAAQEKIDEIRQLVG